jgi:hypothetical protein
MICEHAGKKTFFITLRPRSGDRYPLVVIVNRELTSS